jgi:hypothetical protein
MCGGGRVSGEAGAECLFFGPGQSGKGMMMDNDAQMPGIGGERGRLRMCSNERVTGPVRAIGRRCKEDYSHSHFPQTAAFAYLAEGW